MSPSKVKSPVRFSTGQWQRIRQTLSDAQRRQEWSVDDPMVKRSLEQIADEFCRIGRSAALEEHMRARAKQQKARYAAGARKAQALANYVEMLPQRGRVVWLTDLKEKLTKLSEAAAASAARRRPPPNVDTERNMAWARAGVIYELVARPVAVSARSNRDTGPPGGPFVRFIQAFMAAIPGESEPTGDELRGWFRAHWKKWRAALRDRGERREDL